MCVHDKREGCKRACDSGPLTRRGCGGGRAREGWLRPEMRPDGLVGWVVGDGGLNCVQQCLCVGCWCVGDGDGGSWSFRHLHYLVLEVGCILQYLTVLYFYRTAHSTAQHDAQDVWLLCITRRLANFTKPTIQFQFPRLLGGRDGIWVPPPSPFSSPTARVSGI